ncbi:MAG: hydantoinase/oxoprolinase family protein, partial [Gammaproteobacteria bacterium]|nr:hydantoinase/oxoprolinase family protein [Gammaproteobacteria bacterium]
GHANPDEAIQLVNLRLSAIGKLTGLEPRQERAGGEARKGRRPVWFKPTGWIECAIYERDLAGRIEGPAVIEALDATIVVPPGWTARPNESGHIIMEASSHGE